MSSFENLYLHPVPKRIATYSHVAHNFIGESSCSFCFIDMFKSFLAFFLWRRCLTSLTVAAATFLYNLDKDAVTLLEYIPVACAIEGRRIENDRFYINFSNHFPVC